MSAFEVSDLERFQRLDWTILQTGAISLYWKQDILEEACRWFRDNQYVIHNFDCTQWKSEEDFHTEVSLTLGFPEYYGCNLDAFNDSLSCIEIQTKGGMVLVFHRFDTFARTFPRAAYIILDIIECNSRGFLLTGQRLIALVQSNDPEISFDPVGARPVAWNPKEWPKKNREL
jgi:RNAse (barnase) inhibitor barstar